MTSPLSKFIPTFLVYLVTAVVITCSIVYDELYIHDTEKKYTFAGKWQFLTHWTLYIEAFYWWTVVLAGLSNRCYVQRNGLLHRIVDYLHASVAFPIGMMVCIMFWTLYGIDRELVYPKRLDAIIPTWLNHVMHTIYVPCLALDKYLVLHRYPKSSDGLLLCLVIPFFYQVWVMYLALQHQVWVYPVLAVLDWPAKIAFFLANWVLFVIVYKAGEALTNKIWGRKPVRAGRKDN
ncbi:androgen-induced gene 1 protein-like [Watersipora subatra]|uniref:androgen-induced gene 1 protein-like n=1 Tax=Watersipora subatra TaxID=2589382 RepID=UPI00355C0C35